MNMVLVAPPITGLAALAKRAPNPDKDNGPKLADKKHPKNKDGGKTTIPAFMPGQQAALAQQLNQGFGGGRGQWNNYLDQVYSPLTIPPFVPGLPAGNGGGNNGSGNGHGLPDGGQVIGPDGRPINPNDPRYPAAAAGLAALRGRY